MKSITCAQLGGPCELVHEGASADEVIKAQDKHLNEAVAAGDNAHRLHSEAAFAALCGTNPVPASSGKITRYRLNRGGNRQANAALHRASITRLHWQGPGQVEP